jgi:elongator complex protein 5
VSFTRVSDVFTGFLVLIDSLTFLASLSVQAGSPLNLAAYLSSILLPPQGSAAQISLMAVYHTDVLISTFAAPYSPSPLSTIAYLATTIITVHSLAILVAEKAARDRSLPAPVFGLAQEVEGIVIGLKSTLRIKSSEEGIVLELEHRRKSGRGVLEWYFLPSNPSRATPQTYRETVILLDDHPLFRKDIELPATSDADLTDMTFSLGLTERQREERDGVVLPYMDAQRSGAPNEGGRILYDMGVEDDFDDEEDEI